MQIKLTNAVSTIIAEWAKMRGHSASDLVNAICRNACEHYLDGKKASLDKIGKDQA